MNRSNPARRAAGALATALLLAGAAQADTAGTVAFLQGDVGIRGAQGQLRPAQRGAPVEAGETVETGAGRAQLRMSDGAYISLQPQTALRLDVYQSATGSQPESGVMSLLRGGLRTITGLIGRTNRQNYRLSTPTATVGIRGTEFLATADNGTRVRVAGGAVALCTEGGGCVTVPAGQTGYAPSSAATPQIVAEAPSLPPNPAPELPNRFMVAEQRDGEGRSLAVAGFGPVDSQPTPPPVVYETPLPNGTADFAEYYATTFGSTSGGILGGSTTYGSRGELLTFSDCCSGPSFSSGTVADSGADGTLAWGRWSAGSDRGSPLAVLHYVANNTLDRPTMPVVRAFASFASTAPTLVSNAGTVLDVGTANSVTGTLNVNFASTSGGTLTYALSVPISGQTFSVNGSANQYGSYGNTFLGTGSVITSTGGGCASTCAGAIPYADAFQGVIGGNGSSQRAGGTYAFTTSLGGTVSGAIVFK